jgi:hypothetical protein
LLRKKARQLVSLFAERSRPFPTVKRRVYNHKTVDADIIRLFLNGRGYNPSVIFGDISPFGKAGRFIKEKTPGWSIPVFFLFL